MDTITNTLTLGELRIFNETYKAPTDGGPCKLQYKHYERTFTDGDQHGRIVATVRYDDECGNGHETFSITGELYLSPRPGERKRKDEPDMCGCIHGEIARYIPELAHAIPYHLVSADGPLHYIANTVHHAGNRDCWGKRKGEPYGYETSIQFGANPIKRTFKRGQKFIKWLESATGHSGRDRFDFEVLRIDHENKRGESYQFDPKYTFGGFDAEWYQCPFDTETEALDFLTALQTCDPQFVKIPTAWGKGKERELDHARSSAVWPEATDEELSVDPEALTEALKARLPALMERFKAVVVGLGFVYREQSRA